jgi:hypothetical protein
VLLTMGVLTKWTAAVLPLPGLLLYAAWRRRLVPILRCRGAWIAALLPVLAVSAYLALMELKNPGVVRYIFLGDYYRATVTMWRMEGDSLFYVHELLGRFVPWASLQQLGELPELSDRWLPGRFVPWAYLLPLCLGLLIFGGQERLKALGLLSLCFVGTFLVAISGVTTKAIWYDAPIYPLAALAIGAALERVLHVLSRELGWPGTAGALCLAIAVCCQVPRDAIAATVNHGETEWRYGLDEEGSAAYRDYLRRARHILEGLPAVKVIAGDSKGSAIFYTNLARRQGLPVRMSTLFDVDPGDDVLTCHPHLRLALSALFDAEELNGDGCWLVHVKGLRSK